MDRDRAVREFNHQYQMKPILKYSSAKKTQSNFDKKLHGNTPIFVYTGKKSTVGTRTQGEVSPFMASVNIKNEKLRKNKNNTNSISSGRGQINNKS